PERVAALVLLSTAARIEPSAESVETWRKVMTGREPQPFTPTGYGDDVPFELMREGWGMQVLTDPRVRYFDLLAVGTADYRARLSRGRRPDARRRRRPVHRGSRADRRHRARQSSELAPDLSRFDEPRGLFLRRARRPCLGGDRRGPVQRGADPLRLDRGIRSL